MEVVNKNGKAPKMSRAEIKAYNKKVAKAKKDRTPEEKKLAVSMRKFQDFDVRIKKAITSEKGVSSIVFYADETGEQSGGIHGVVENAAGAVLAAMRNDKRIYDLFRILVGEIEKEGIYDEPDGTEIIESEEVRDEKVV